MKTTIIPEWDTTTRTRNKTIKGPENRERIANIEATEERTGDTTRRIRIVTNTEGLPIETRDRKNENGGRPTEEECMNQLQQAREELEGEAEERAMNERANNRGRDEAEYCRVDKTDYANTKTNEEQEERIERTKNDIITKLK